jgi:CBS domain containing-hemolysin-like protein
LSGYKKKTSLIPALIVAFITFFIAFSVSLGSETLLNTIDNIIFAVILLLIIIFLGIFFDIIGTAATAAQMPPFNARAAKKVCGAKQAVNIVKNSHIVANYCNDVIGDIAGTLSGAIGAGIVLSLLDKLEFMDVVLSGAVMTSLIAALTVGGKALGKKLAVNHANSIIFRVAIIIALLENTKDKLIFKNRG